LDRTGHGEIENLVSNDREERTGIEFRVFICFYNEKHMMVVVKIV
jgi:hypothetical protein